MIRSDAIIVCSCNWKVGSISRAAMHEDMAEAERELLGLQVPRMVRHWRLGHLLTLQEPAFGDVIARVATEMAKGEVVAEPISVEYQLEAIEE